MQNKMKLVAIAALSALVLTMGCNSKGKTEASNEKDSMVAVIDSIIEENDTTPMPMFLMRNDGQSMQVLYWSPLEEPQKSGDDDEYFEESHQRWTLQEMFRRNKAQYTNMFMDDKFVKIKYVDEVLKDPDGNTPSIGEVHRTEIPSLCARFDFANAKDRKISEYGYYECGTVIVTDSYLKSRRLLAVKYKEPESEAPVPLSAAAVKQLEKKYGMEVQRQQLTATIGDSIVWGTLQFKGEYKNAPKDPYDKDRRSALALDVLICGDKVYAHEDIGYYDEEYGPSWNADDGGEYVGCYIMAAFEGPKGLELCFGRDAPESSAVGMFYVRSGQLIQHTYETYHNLVDEELPVWKKDIAEMRRLYLAEDPAENKRVTLTKYAHFYLDYKHNWIWMRDSTNQHGAFFIQQNDKFTLIAVETPRLKPSTMEADGIDYLQLSGSAGGPSTYRQVYAFKDGQLKERFTALSIYDEIDESTLNGKTISKEQAEEYIAKLPAAEPLTAYFTEIDE